MIKEIKTDELRCGMFVSLPKSWFQHSFLNDSFLISTQKQLNKIRKMDLDKINIDTSKGIDVVGKTIISKPPVKIAVEEEITNQLENTVKDTSLPPDVKAKAVYSQSLKLMDNLLKNPTAEVISEGKKGICYMVDMILSDDETTDHMINIVSYDYYTYTHSLNVGIYSVALSKKLYKGGNSHDMHELGAGFFLHDLGKVRIDSDIINKKGKLTDAEMRQMRAHPGYSYRLLEETKQLSKEAGIIAFQHHERADGKGYPRGLKGNQIHEYGRICSIADVYDALTSKRSYKKQMQPFEALKIMKEELLGHFHEDIFAQFVKLFS